MSLKSKFVLLSTAFCLTLPVAHAAPKSEIDGAEGGGGGFQYYYTVGSYYRNVKNFMAETITYLASDEATARERKLITDLEEKYNLRIDWQKFAQVIRSAKADPDKIVKRISPDGYQEPLFFDYDLTTGSILALKPFFDLFNKLVLSQEEALELQRLILHEASHVFGMGISNDDKISFNFSTELRNILSWYWYRCGNNDDGPMTILKCDYQNYPSRRKKLIVSTAAVGGNSYLEKCTTKINVYRPSAQGDRWVSVGVLGGGPQENTGKAEFDISQIESDMVMTFRHSCEGYGRMTFKFLDENGIVRGARSSKDNNWDYSFGDDSNVSLRGDLILNGDGGIFFRW